MKVVLVILLLLLLLLQYRVWVGEGSVAEVSSLKAQVAAQRDENQRLQQRNRQLEADVEDLKQGLAAIEERARAELGMIKKDETFYMVIEKAGEEAADK